MYDVITLGETMLRLTPPDRRRIEAAGAFEIEVGGSESNTAVGLARLGLRVAWRSRLTANGLGWRIARAIAAQGVDVAHVAWTDADRVGVYYLEEGASPRESRVIYDRAASAFSRITPADLPAEPFAARLLHLTGITPALSASAADTAAALRDRALDAGATFSFDVNYRAKLWSPANARAGCAAFLRVAHLAFIPLRDAITLYGLPADITPDAALDAMRAHCPHAAAIVMTMGERGAVACDAAGQVFAQPAFPAEPIGRIGGGDAFAAGYLYGHLLTGAVADALRWGAAVAALKYATPGDMPLIDREDARRLVEGAGGGGLRR